MLGFSSIPVRQHGHTKKEKKKNKMIKNKKKKVSSPDLIGYGAVGPRACGKLSPSIIFTLHAPFFGNLCPPFARP